MRKLISGKGQTRKGQVQEGGLGTIRRYVCGAVFLYFAWQYSPKLFRNLQAWWEHSETEASDDDDQEDGYESEENIIECEDNSPDSMTLKVISSVQSQAYVMLARLFYQFSSRERAEVYYAAAAVMKPCDASIHYSLGSLQYEREDIAAAEVSFETAVKADPQHTFARLRLQGIRSRRGHATFWSSLISVVNAQPEILKQLQNGSTWDEIKVPLQAKEDTATHLDRLDAIFSSTPPRNFAMLMPPAIEHDLPHILAQEAALFKDTVVESARAAVAPALIDALKDMHDVVNSTSWLMTWGLERLLRFGDPNNRTGGEYGLTWFMSWLQAMKNDHVKQAIRLQPGNATVVVVGSGLGYQCLFALVAGAARCIGYEVLCRSLVEPGKKIIEKHGLQSMIELKCVDGRLATEFTEASLVWMNDAMFPAASRDHLQKLLAHHLRHEAVAVSYNPPSEELWRKAALQVVDVIRVMLSWTTSAGLYILVKHPPFIKGGGATPAGRGSRKRKKGKRRNSLSDL